MGKSKARIAILGGGVSALSAAFALTEIDPKGEKYAITLYQLGWRLGGKTASGRNAEYGQRVEEHGLHIWAGFYENAFTIMRIVLKALNRPPTHPMATIADAFKRQNRIFYSEKTGEQWQPWPFWFEPDADESKFPGRDDLWAPDNVVPSLADLLRRAIAAIIYGLNYYGGDWPGDHHLEAALALAQMPHAQQIRLAKLSASGATGHPLLVLASAAGEGLSSDIASVRRRAEADTIASLRAFQRLVKQYLGSGGLKAGLRRILLIANLGICMLLGILENDCLTKGLEVLDRHEFIDFLKQQDADAPNNAIVTALYEYIFAYQNGSRDRPSVSACTAVQGLLRLFFTFKGAFFFKAVYGMGDTICTPLYQLLKQRGVKFEFFRRVTCLEPSPDGNEIGTILIDRQVELADGVSEYDPLTTVKGFECWPSSPHWKQLKDGELLAAAGYNFENTYGPPLPPVSGPELRLQLGRDFDTVILAIPVGALREICKPLMLQRKAWADMIDNLPTVRTQALQLWVRSGVKDLGGPYCNPLDQPPRETMGPIVTTCKPPFDTYSDMSQLLPAEAWGGPAPLSIAYFCAVMADEAAPNDAAAAADKVKCDARDWMTSWLDTLWTNIGGGGQFRWDLLHSPNNLAGPARLDDQYWRANINPGERYVLSLPGTLCRRMEPGKSGYANLYLAGDWTMVPEINAGCVEVAAMSGLAAASALSGVHIPIISMSSQGDRIMDMKPLPVTKPSYVNYAGWNTLPPPPYFCNDTTFYSFCFPTASKACKDFLDRSYNAVAGGDRFRVLLDLMFLNIVQSRKTGALTPPFSEQGTISATDIGFWLLVGSYEPGGSVPTSVGFVPAYLFVDNAWSVIAARDVWGYPKYPAAISLPETAPSYGPFEVSALAVAKFAPEAHASLQRMLKLSGTPIQSPSPADRRAAAAGAAVSSVEIFKQLCVGADAAQLKQLTEHPDIPEFLSTPGGFPSQVFYLKQERSSDSTVTASYQTLLQGDLSLTKVKPGKCGLRFGNWSLELGDFDSHPFIRDLGLGTPTDGKLVLTTTVGFWAEIDFIVGMASPIA